MRHFAFVLILASTTFNAGADSSKQAVMSGYPPARDSQVTAFNYGVYPNSQWAFHHIPSVLNVAMIPRGGPINTLESKSHDGFAHLNALFEENYADGLAIMHNDKIIHEKYFGSFDASAHHIWYSMTKSLVSTAFGILVHDKDIDLDKSPADFIPELKNSGWDRVTLQQVLDHSTAIDFQENYTDPESEFARYYAPALNMLPLPGSRDADPASTEIYGAYDFLARFIKPRKDQKPGEVFDYNSSNTDVLGWLISRISNMSLERYLATHIWSKLGAEHDATIIVDRALMPVAAGGMNSTLRDALRFAQMILNRGRSGDQQLVSREWVDATLEIDDGYKNRMANNGRYESGPWQAYKNMWWILDSEAGEYAASGVFGQVIYVNRSKNVAAAWFSSQPTASSVVSPSYHVKMDAVRKAVGAL